MIERFVPRASSHINYAEWDDISEDFLVQFDDGSNYLVRNVPRQTYRALTISSSAGGFYHRQIARLGAERVPYETLEQQAA